MCGYTANSILHGIKAEKTQRGAHGQLEKAHERRN